MPNHRCIDKVVKSDSAVTGIYNQFNVFGFTNPLGALGVAPHGNLGNAAEKRESTERDSGFLAISGNIHNRYLNINVMQMQAKTSTKIKILKGRVEDYLRTNEINLTEFAAKVGKPAATISRLLSGTTTQPHPGTIQAIENVIGFKKPETTIQINGGNKQGMETLYRTVLDIQGALLKITERIDGIEKRLGELSAVGRRSTVR